VLPARSLERSVFDRLSSRLDLLGHVEIDVPRRDVVERFVVPLMVGIVDEAADLLLQAPARICFTKDAC
jgi:hypothetical protein